MTSDNLKEYKGRHTRKLWYVHGQMDHLCSKNWLCMCKHNGATMIMACNAASSKKISHQKVQPYRAIACGDSYSDQVRIAAMLVNTEPWNEVIIVGDRDGPLYDQRAGILHVKTPSELPSIESFDPKKRTLVVFDECGGVQGRDLMIMEAFFIRSRLRGVFTLSVECDMAFVPEMVRKNTDALYLTTPPRPKEWEKIRRLVNCARTPVVDCVAGARPKSWFKIDLRNNEVEILSLNTSAVSNKDGCNKRAQPTKSSGVPLVYSN